MHARTRPKHRSLSFVLDALQRDVMRASEVQPEQPLTAEDDSDRDMLHVLGEKLVLSRWAQTMAQVCVSACVSVRAS